MDKPSLIVSILFLFPSLISASVATVHVRGQLMCNGEPFKNEKVEVYEKNILGADTKMASAVTNEHGLFSMKASVTEWAFFYPNPYIYIPNYCNVIRKMGSMECAHTIKIYVPGEFVTEGHLGKSIFDIGKVDLKGAETEKQWLEKFVYAIFKQTECRDVKK